MANYLVQLSRKAQKQLDKLPDSIADPLIRAISALEDDPRPSGSKKLKGRDGYRIRIGNYRVIYTVINSLLVVEVVTLGHRKDIYE